MRQKKGPQANKTPAKPAAAPKPTPTPKEEKAKESKKNKKNEPLEEPAAKKQKTQTVADAVNTILAEKKVSNVSSLLFLLPYLS